jgi:hypothetical protein
MCDRCEKRIPTVEVLAALFGAGITAFGLSLLLLVALQVGSVVGLVNFESAQTVNGVATIQEPNPPHRD